MRDDDEHAAFERPRRRTRPRTKDRPDYSDADVGRVVTIDRGRYTVAVAQADGSEGGGDGERVITAMKARTLRDGDGRRQSVVVGDEVRVVGDTSGEEGTLARIVEVMERRSVLRRTADDDDPIERIVVANADQLVIVTALADPPPRIGLVDRCLVAAYDAGLDPLLCLTKADLGDPAPVLQLVEPLDVDVVVTQRDGDLDSLLARLTDRTSVLIGHSGVGKSTLVNRLVPEADRATSHVNEVTGRGRHTSTSAMVLELPAGGWIIDTPGFRSFGLAHVDVADIITAFPDLDEAAQACPRGCTHSADEPECGLDLAVEAGTVRADRVASFRRILASRDSLETY